ncbi:MAG: hypothetical protein ACOC24_03015 [Desulfovibrionales bacterium]
MKTRDLRSSGEWPEQEEVEEMESGTQQEARTENRYESRAADMLDELAGKIRELGEMAKQRVDEEIDFYTLAASDRIENFAECLRTQDFEAAFTKITERIGTKQTLVLGSVLVSGIALSVYLKGRK